MSPPILMFLNMLGSTTTPFSTLDVVAVKVSMILKNDHIYM